MTQYTCPECGYTDAEEKFLDIYIDSIMENDLSSTFTDDFKTELPCYMTHIWSTEDLSSNVDVGVFLEKYCAKYTVPDNLVSFSVSSNESRYLEWLEAVQDYPGAHITKIKRKGLTGNYHVYFVTFPVTPQL